METHRKLWIGGTPLEWSFFTAPPTVRAVKCGARHSKARNPVSDNCGTEAIVFGLEFEEKGIFSR
jgi:hypothetical protein